MAPATDNHSETAGPVRVREILDLVDDSSLGPEALDGDLAAGESRGLRVDIGQFHLGLASAAMLAVAHREPEMRIAVACTMPPADLMVSAKAIRVHLSAVARFVADAVREAADD